MPLAHHHAAPPRVVRPQPCFAALDLGTNNCRLLMATPSTGGFRVVDSFSRVVRLGEGLEVSGVLGEAPMARTLEALRACAGRMAARQPLRVRAIATEACRRARNGTDFLRRVTAETGLAFEIITPREEAELALESCRALLAPDQRRALLFDIGGGSTELVWVRRGAAGPEVIGTTSLPVGVVTLAERVGSRIETEAGFAATVDGLAAQFAAFERTHRIGAEIARGGVQVLGTSGTVTTLAGLVLGLRRYQRQRVDGTVLEMEAALGAVRSLRAMRPDERAAHPCVGPERVGLMLPGCAVFAAICRVWPAESVTVADRGLREGVLLRLMRRP